jgi:hypothetical protein
VADSPRTCEQNPKLYRRVRIHEDKKIRKINVFRKNGALRKFSACICAFAPAQRMGLSGILS